VPVFSPLAAAVIRRALLAVLALGVMFGLAGMHEVISGPNAADSAVAVHMEHVVAHQHSPAAGENDLAAHPASVVLGATMGDMAHAMETCCAALVTVVALAVLAAPGALGSLTALRPRGQPAPPAWLRPMRGIERNLTLGVLRI